MKIFQNLMLFAFVAVLASCNNAPKGEEATTDEAAEPAAATGQPYSVVSDKSMVSWTGAKLTGEHTGTFNVSDGKVLVANNSLTGGKFTIDIASMNNTDLEGEEKANLEGHLKSGDFFDVEQFPNSAFEITEIMALEGDSTATHLVKGNLSLKDVTKEIGFKANIEMEDNMVRVSTPDFTINRTDFNMKYGSASFFDGLKDKAINDEVGLNINLVAMK